MITNTYTVRISAVRKGDNVVNSGLVAGTKNGPAWTVLTFEDTAVKPLRLRNDEMVTVARLEKTEEEKAAEMVEMKILMANNARTSAYAALEKATAKLSENAANAAVNYSVLEQFLLAQASAKVWHKIDDMVGFPQNLNLSLDEVVDKFVTIAKARMFESHYGSALSRSTSVVSNLLDDVDRDALMKFFQFRDARWSF